MQMNLGPTSVYSSVTQSLKYIVGKEGVLRLWRGMSSVLLGAGPAHALYFMVYEEAKSLMLQGNLQHEGHSPFITSKDNLVNSL